MMTLKFTLLALVAILALAFAACGGDDDDTADSGDDPTAAAQTDDSGEGDDGDDEEPTEAGGDGSDDPTDDPDGDGSGEDVGHACDLLTPAEVSAAVGVEVAEGRDYSATAANATQCEWQSTDGTVTVYAEVLTEGGRSWFDAVHIADSDPAFTEEPVEGIGDEAIYSDLGVLDVVEGDNFVSVQMVVFFSDVEELPAATALADAILAELE